MITTEGQTAPASVVGDSVVTFRKSGNILEVSTGGQGPPPEEVRRLIEPHLRYDYIRHLYGAERWDPVAGIQRNVEVTPKQLYRYDERGRMVCGFGFHTRLVKVAQDAGFGVMFIDKDPPRERPKCFEPDWGAVRRKFQFKARQEECLENIAKSHCGVVHAITGFGKMVIIAMVCVLYPNAKIAVVTRRKDLVNKLYLFLHRYVGQVGQVGGGRRTYGRVTIYTAASLHHCPFDNDLLLCDEAHELMAEDSSRALVKSRYSRNFAFTASPEGRLDGTDIRMESLFGLPIFHISYPDGVKLGLVVPIRVEWSDVKIDCNPCAGMGGVKRERWGLWRNRWRNEAIAVKARTFGDEDQVQILVKTIEHAVHLRQHLPEFTMVYDAMEMDDRAGYIRSGLLDENEPIMKPDKREMLRRQFEAGELKKVISTNVWAVGIDPVQLTAFVRADASASEIMDIQAPGRVSRTHSESGKEVGIVCDFRDQFDSSLSNKARKRFRHYKGMGWEQVLGSENGSFTPLR